MSIVTTDSQTVKILKDRLKLYGVPPQGAGFFSSYYAFFRGYGVILSSSEGGVFASIISFFTATSVLFLGCESSGSHIEAAVLAPSILSMEALCSDPTRRPIEAWGMTLTRSLARAENKDPSKFRIELDSNGDARDRDLIVHQLDDLFPPAPTSESVESLKKFLTLVNTSAKRLYLGGFYILALPDTYNGVDLLLSSITATITPQAPLVYVGMILYQEHTLLWVFRIEPMNNAVLESQRTMALTRLMRYPPMLQAVVKEMMPQTSEISSMEPAFEEVLATRVTPTDTLSSLFRTAKNFYPREVINRLGNFQPKFAGMIDKVRTTSELKVQIKIIIELLYDLALAAQRRCAGGFSKARQDL